MSDQFVAIVTALGQGGAFSRYPIARGDRAACERAAQAKLHPPAGPGGMTPPHPGRIDIMAADDWDRLKAEKLV